MKNFVKKSYAFTKKFVNDHKFAIGCAVGASIGIAIARSAAAEHNAFLREHGLYDEFYSIDA